jgi:hypothetical protein
MAAAAAVTARLLWHLQAAAARAFQVLEAMRLAQRWERQARMGVNLAQMLVRQLLPKQI